jgi:putative heme-binding domain-containing protein
LHYSTTRTHGIATRPRASCISGRILPLPRQSRKPFAPRAPAAPELASLIQTAPKSAPVAIPAAIPSNRAQAWDLYRPALARKGNPAQGKTVFETRCAMCHRFSGKGQNVGPDLDAARQAGREKLLGNILEPSREITAGYPLGNVALKDGTTLTGILTNESAAGLLLRYPRRRLPRKSCQHREDRSFREITDARRHRSRTQHGTDGRSARVPLPVVVRHLQNRRRAAFLFCLGRTR